jgi:8-oxo-dGTP pyrophosphatase MutT (NUDIX family)
MADYEKAGLLVVREGRILLCRKKNAPALLILPGGKFEPGETAIQCLLRELREELGEVTATGFQPVGTYTDRAAGDASKTVRIELYGGELAGTPVASAEIGELIWFGEGDDWAQLAPSLANRILPDLIARGLLDWSRNDPR